VHFAYANPTNTNPQDNTVPTKDNSKTTPAIYPQLNQGYSEELSQNLHQKTYPHDIENQNAPLLNPSDKNNAGFKKIKNMDEKTLLKLVCLCVVAPAVIFSATFIAGAYLIMQNFNSK
jgi:hypothetical protein